MGDNPSKSEPQAASSDPGAEVPAAEPMAEPSFELQPGRPNITYYWIDRRVYNAENQMCYNFFRRQFRMEIFTSIEGLRFVLEQGEPEHMVKVLTAAGLPDEDFRYLHNEPKVAEVFLYCANEERAKLLVRNFTKIAGYGLRKEDVAEKMRAAEGRPPREVAPITEELIGRRAEGLGNGSSSSEKPLEPTSAGTNAQLATSSAVNVNNSVVGVSLDPAVVANVNQSSVIVDMNPNVNRSAVNVNVNPPVNVNLSSVIVNLDPAVNPVNVNQSSVVVNLDPPKPVNINNSTVDVVL